MVITMDVGYTNRFFGSRVIFAALYERKIAALQFHGVPDNEHSWVHTPPQRFKEYSVRRIGVRRIGVNS